MYEGKLDILCHPHTNDCKIYKYLFWNQYLNMKNKALVEFGLISFSNISALTENVKMELLWNLLSAIKVEQGDLSSAGMSVRQSCLTNQELAGSQLVKSQSDGRPMKFHCR